jgi:hypothetical protein
MKLIRTLALASFILFGATSMAQDKPKGYDIGGCGVTTFSAAHFVVDGNDMRVDKYSPGPDVVKDAANGVTYKFILEDKDGKHFVYTKDDTKYEFVLLLDKSVGKFEINGEIKVIALIMKDDDGSKLAENAKQMYQSCVVLMNDSSDDSKS